MRLLIMICSIWAIVYGKPEMYKEKEDFQFSRSSSDDGSKSGYYGAQRGNMGGNYEKAHNMDSLAQHQMSTLVRQVDGELGEAANTRTGSVFTSGNSRGLYGSGNYDLTNLHGRNFEEGVSYGDSQSQSSLSSQHSGYTGSSFSAANNARYSANQLRASGLSSTYRQAGLASQYGQFDNQQAESQYSGASNYERGSQAASNYKYYSHGGSQAQSEYDQSNTNLNSFSNIDDSSKSRLIKTPVRVYVKPGTRVAIPVAAQTYDASQISSLHDLNAVNTEADLLSINGQRVNAIKPKHYESSYSYHKEWEKHDTQPVTVMPTENPFPKNSELYEDTQLSQAAGQRYQSALDSSNLQSSASNSAYARDVNSGYATRYTANTKSAAANRLQYQSQQQSSGLSANSNLYALDTQNSGVAANLNNLVENTNSKPKSYHSSYSYHKSWERRGDPYVIKPVEGDLSGQASQRLLAATADQNLYSSGLYGNQYRQTKTSCDELCHLRKRRSYDVDWANFDTVGQQTQNKWDDVESLGQQTQNQWGNLEDLGQQTQNKWDNLEILNQHPQSDFEELSQQPQNHLELEDLGQQTQNIDNLESYNQHSQSGFEVSSQPLNQLGGLEDLGQMDHFKEIGQQTQNKWDNSEILNQHPQSDFEELSQQPQNHLSELEDLGQQTQNIDNLESYNQHSQSGFKVSSQPLHQLGNLDDLSQLDHFKEISQQSQNTWDNLEKTNQQSQDWSGGLGQQSQSQWQHLESLGQEKQNQWNHFENSGQQTQNLWDKFEQLTPQKQDTSNDQQTYNNWNRIEDQQSTGNFEEYKRNLELWAHQNQNSGDSLDQTTFFHNMQPVWNKINTLEAQKNYENSMVHHQQVSFTQEHNWNEYRDNFNQVVTRPQDHPFQDFIPSPVTNNEKKHTMTNTELNLWDTIDKLIKDSDKNRHNVQPTESNKNLETNSKDTITLPRSNITEINKKGDSSKTNTSKPIVNEVGRGDIGPEDTPVVSIETSGQSPDDKVEDTVSPKNFNKLFKTQQEIESLSLKHIDEDQNGNKLSGKPIILSVIGLENKVGVTSIPTTTPTLKYFNKYDDDDQIIISKEFNTTSFISPSNVETEPKYEEVNVKNSEVQIPEVYKQQEIELLSSKHIDEDQHSKKLSGKPTILSVVGLENQVAVTSIPTTTPTLKYFNKYDDEDQIIISKEFNTTSFKSPSNDEIEPKYEEVNMKNSKVQIPEVYEQQQHFAPSFLDQQQQHFVPSFLDQQQHFVPSLVDQQQISNMDNVFMDFGQQQQVQVPFSKNMHKELYTPQEIGNFDNDLQSKHEEVPSKILHDNHNKEPLNDNQRSSHTVINLESVPKNKDNMLIGPTESTEKPGFWKSIWNKTKSAKESVVSWFKS